MMAQVEGAPGPELEHWTHTRSTALAPRQTRRYANLRGNCGMMRWRVGLLLLAAGFGRTALAGVVELSPITP